MKYIIDPQKIIKRKRAGSLFVPSNMRKRTPHNKAVKKVIYFHEKACGTPKTIVDFGNCTCVPYVMEIRENGKPVEPKKKFIKFS